MDELSPDPYAVIELLIRDSPARSIEQIGSKPKFWIAIRSSTQELLGLFKQTRPETGEAWAERVVHQLAELLGLPRARYDLALYRGGPDRPSTRGVISWSFLQPNESLIHGNEVLSALMTNYPRASGPRFRRTPEHTVDRVLDQCRNVAVPPRWDPPPGIVDGAEVMVGHLLLDAWVGNTNRHDENWGWIQLPGGAIHLAPTYDHSSSLGRNETDRRRAERLATTDAGNTVTAYALRAPSGLHRTDGTQMRVLEAFERAAELRPSAAAVWLERLARVPSDDIETAVTRVPADWITPLARDFAIGILKATGERLLGVARATR